MRERSKLEKARRASGMSLDAAAALIGVSKPTYTSRERNPLLMTFGELFTVVSEMDSDSKQIAEGVFDEVKPKARESRSLRDMTLGEYFGFFNSSNRLESELKDERRRVFG